jgi:Flp pilus assembly protein TadD
MLVDEGQIDAAEDFLLASKVVDHAPAVKQLLGHISMIRGLPAEAADRFTDAWLLSPSDAVIHEDLITAQVAAGRYAEAEAGIRDLLNDPDAGHASAPRDLEHMRAMCLIALGRPMDARQIYRKLTSNADGASDVEAWIGLGRSSFLVGDLRRLGLASERVRTLAPGRPEGRALTALWHRAKGDPGAALGALRGFAFDDPEVLTLRALILADLGRFEESRQQLYAVLDAVPDDDAAMGLLDRLPEIEGTYAVAPTDR